MTTKLPIYTIDAIREINHMEELNLQEHNVHQTYHNRWKICRCFVRL